MHQDHTFIIYTAVCYKPSRYHLSHHRPPSIIISSRIKCPPVYTTTPIHVEITSQASQSYHSRWENNNAVQRHQEHVQCRVVSKVRQLTHRARNKSWRKFGSCCSRWHTCVSTHVQSTRIVLGRSCRHGRSLVQVGRLDLDLWASSKWTEGLFRVSRDFSWLRISCVYL